MKTKLLNFSLIVVSTIVGLFLGEQLLRVMGRPSAHPVQVAHPANYTEKREYMEFSYEFKTNSMGLRNEEIPLKKPKGETRFFLVGDSFTEGLGVELKEGFVSIIEDKFAKAGNRNYRFINGGLSAAGPLEYWRIMYRVGFRYDPDYIIICYYANDLSNVEKVVQSKDLEKFYHTYYNNLPFQRRAFYNTFPRFYVFLSQAFESTSQLFRSAAREWRVADAPPFDDIVPIIEQIVEDKDIPRVEFEKWKDTLDPELLWFANRGMGNWPVLTYPLLHPRFLFDALDIDSSGAEDRYRSMVFVLDHMVCVAEERGISLGLLYLPTRYQYDPRAFDPKHPWVKGGMVDKRWLTTTTEIQKRLRRWASEHKIAFHDLTPRFRKEASKGGRLTFAVDGHWNPAGHVVAADEISNWILADDGFLATVTQ